MKNGNFSLGDTVRKLEDLMITQDQLNLIAVFIWPSDKGH
ncbi:hypothetical protein SAMN04515656_10215 [Eubacterium aggregans]|uniref:Uncharacterized protein n=1 Tax=Eubacterium aggregans TaxID=81409 RepID=A0A1H3XES1_9FIRM|nr:hypothetical protein SAMN04515656_10215 [Eubacterium aggregans]